MKTLIAIYVVLATLASLESRLDDNFDRYLRRSGHFCFIPSEADMCLRDVVDSFPGSWVHHVLRVPLGASN